MLSRELVLDWLRSFRTSRSALHFRLRNRFSDAPVRGDAPVVVSLTSYGNRIRAVHLAVESMAHGTVRPRRLILWLREADVVADPPPPLARLVRRGLELRCTEDWGPHQKYYPYVRSQPRHALPLVIADDDVRYDRDALARVALPPREPAGRPAVEAVLEDGTDGAELAAHPLEPRTEGRVRPDGRPGSRDVDRLTHGSAKLGSAERGERDRRNTRPVTGLTGESMAGIWMLRESPAG